MFKNISKLLLIALALSCESNWTTQLEYPKIDSVNFEEFLHNQRIKDPYRNLENLKDSTVINWFTKQGKLTDSILEKIPRRDFFYSRMIEFENRQSEIIRVGQFKEDGSSFYLKKKAKGGVEKLYFRKDIFAKEKLLFDPSTYKKDYIINYFKVSWDLSKVAISTALKGNDESELVVYDLNSDKLLPDIIKGLSPSLVGEIDWLQDNLGFVFLKIPHFDYQDRSYLLNTVATIYRLGNNSKEFTDILSKENNPDLPFKEGDFPIVSILNPDFPYLIGQISSSAEFSDTYFHTLGENAMNYSDGWKKLFSAKQKIAQFFIEGDFLVYRTSNKASNFMICRTLWRTPNFENPEVLVNERTDEVISDFVYINGKTFYTARKNGVQAKLYVKSNSEEKEISLPHSTGAIGLNSIGPDLYVKTYGWTTTPSQYIFDISNGQFKDVTLQKINYPEFDDFVVEEIEVKSHDGALVPLSLIYSNTTIKNGKNRTFLMSYGSYGASYVPFFYLPFLTWISEGGILAVPHVRGGNEKGDDWYKGGFKTTKPNTWKDLIACTEYLISSEYTSQEFIVNYGISAGGIPVGRSITERPDLYAVAIMDSPALNMLRCEFQPNGPGSIDEFGTVKDSTEFMALKAMDSYHHLKEDESYPAVLIQVGMKDGVVTPWDPGKFIARLQNATSTKKPALFSVDFEAGHGGDGTTEKTYKNLSELFTFACWQTGHPDFQIPN